MKLRRPRTKHPNLTLLLRRLLRASIPDDEIGRKTFAFLRESDGTVLEVACYSRQSLNRCQIPRQNFCLWERYFSVDCWRKETFFLVKSRKQKGRRELASLKRLTSIRDRGLVDFWQLNHHFREHPPCKPNKSLGNP